MKKLIFKVALVAAVAAMAGYGVYTNQTQETMSDVMLANVEALAGDGEVIIGIPCMYVPNNWCLYFYPWEVWDEDGVPYE